MMKQIVTIQTFCGLPKLWFRNREIFGKYVSRTLWHPHMSWLEQRNRRFDGGTHRPAFSTWMPPTFPASSFAYPPPTQQVPGEGTATG